jgi:hypothetical protein
MEYNNVFDVRIRNSLIRYNGIAALIHFVASIVIIIVVVIFDIPLRLYLQKQYFTIYDDLTPGYLTSNYCPTNNGTLLPGSIEYFNGFNFLKCLRSNNQDPNVPRVLRAQDIGSLEIWPFILAMELVSMFFNYVVGFYPYVTLKYVYLLKLGISPFKYIHFAITHPLAVLSLLALNEITDIYLIIYVATTTACLNVCFFLGFEILTSIGNIPSLDYERKVLISYLKWTMLMFAYFFFILPIVLIHETYHLSIETYFEMDNKKFWIDVYRLVIVVNIGITMIYAAFPILHGIQNTYIFKYYLQNVEYIAFEPFFIINSTLAHSFLAVSIIINSIQRY